MTILITCAPPQSKRRAENVNTLFTLRTKINLTFTTAKKHKILIIRYIFVSFLLLSQLAWANNIDFKSVSHSEVPQVKVNLGEKITFHSTNLNEKRAFFVRLPDDYHQTKRDYPVIYLLDANNETLTYMKNLYFHSVTQIERLMHHGDIPQSIIVGIPFKSSQWYNNVVGNSKPYQDYLTHELSPHINNHYRTLNNNTLIGQSYSAVFVINTLAKSKDTFNSYIAIEPVLANGELEKSIANYKSTLVKKANLQIIMAGAIMLHEAQELSEQITTLTAKKVNVNLEIFSAESHGSVYYPALNSALRRNFKDYRQPEKEQILSANFGYKSLIEYFEKRAEKYQVETSEQQFQSAVFNTIFYQLKAKKFEQAFALWHVWQSPYKVYNANRVINFFLQNNDSISAIALLQHLSNAMPTSVSAFDRLATIYQQDQQIEQAKKYQLKVQELLTDIFSKPVSAQQENSLNRYGYSLLREQRNQDAIAVFKRITLANPESINALDSLAEAYQATNNYPAAIKALEKAIAIASNRENVNTTSLQQRLNHLKSLVDDD